MAQTEKHHRSIAPRLRVNARGLRQSSTDAEKKMWRLLRDRSLVGFKFRRQVPFESYILDFVCFERRLVVEIDGSQHMDSPRDGARDGDLREAGYRVIRYWNNDVLLRPLSVLEDLMTRLTEREENPSPRSGRRPERPSPARGEGGRARGEG